MSGLFFFDKYEVCDGSVIYSNGCFSGNKDKVFLSFHWYAIVILKSPSREHLGSLLYAKRLHVKSPCHVDISRLFPAFSTALLKLSFSSAVSPISPFPMSLSFTRCSSTWINLISFPRHDFGCKPAPLTCSKALCRNNERSKENIARCCRTGVNAIKNKPLCKASPWKHNRGAGLDVHPWSTFTFGMKC